MPSPANDPIHMAAPASPASPALLPSPAQPVSVRLVPSLRSLAIWRIASLVGSILLWALCPPSRLEAQFQELSASERAAVEIAVAYCDRGASSVLDWLDESAWLAELDQQSAEAEVAARLGPPCEGRWTLQTTEAAVARSSAVFEIEFESGVDDELLLQFIDDGSGPRLFAIRSLAEPSIAAEDREAVVEARGDPSAMPAPIAGWVALWLLLLTGLVGLVVEEPAPGRLARGLGFLALATCFVGVSCRQADDTSADESTVSPAGVRRLGALADVRMAIAAGRDATTPQPLADDAQQVLALWRLQSDLAGDAGLERARNTLDAIAGLDRVPLAYKLRARMALLADDKAEMVLAYRRLRELFPVTDGRLTEEALALRARGFRPEASQLLLRAREMGSRQAQPYYAISQDAVLNNDAEGAERAFRTAWQLRPSSRRELFDDPLLSLVADPRLDTYGLLELGRPEEPVVAVADVSSREIELPPALEVSLVGHHLVVTRGRGVIEVPGGAALAPRGTQAVSAGAFELRREGDLLGALDQLRAQSLEERALSSSVLRDDLVTAGRALARRFRWGDLVRLTDVVDGDIETSPAELVRLRAHALHSLGRLEDSRALLLKLTRATLELERNDPATLYALAHQMARESRFELAMRLVQKANQLLPMPSSEGLLEMYQMQAKLAARFGRLQTEHFEVWHPPGKAELADRISGVLEAERERLSRWIPVRDDAERIIVEMLTVEDFSSYTGGLEVVGLFDGRIKVPFASVYGLHPVLVSILTHELAHAMITDYTSAQAPKWVQEGLAQFVEMVANRTNPLPDYYRRNRMLSFPAIEQVLQGMPNSSLVAAAYEQSLWTFLYLGAERGRSQVRAILDGYRDGRTTAQVLESALGTTVEDFDEELKSWWLNEAPAVWTGEVHRYESYVNPYVQRPGERPFEIRLNRRWWDAENR